MLIALDANEANVSQRVGINQYAYYLLQSLSELDRKNHYRIYLKSEPGSDFPPATPRWQYRILKPTRLWTQLRLPLALIYQKPLPQVFFTLGHYRPRYCPCPTAITIMDLSYFHYPHLFKRTDLIKLKNWTAYSVKKSARILTISEFSKREIIKYYQLDPAKITVTYPGVDHHRFIYPLSKAKINHILAKYHLPEKYLLFVGTLQPRKNLNRLINAYHQLSPVVPLVIAGKKGWLYQDIFNQAQQLSVQGKIIFTDFIDDSDLPPLLAQAICLILPGLYEGFGLPALEALAVGTPVLASCNTAFPEVVGSAGIFFDPYQESAIQAALKQMIGFYFHERVKYNQLVRRGLKQANKFNWHRTAQKTLEVLHDLAV